MVESVRDYCRRLDIPDDFPIAVRRMFRVYLWSAYQGSLLPFYLHVLQPSSVRSGRSRRAEDARTHF